MCHAGFHAQIPLHGGTRRTLHSKNMNVTRRPGLTVIKDSRVPSVEAHLLEQLPGIGYACVLQQLRPQRDYDHLGWLNHGPRVHRGEYLDVDGANGQIEVSAGARNGGALRKIRAPGLSSGVLKSNTNPGGSIRRDRTAELCSGRLHKLAPPTRAATVAFCTEGSSPTYPGCSSTRVNQPAPPKRAATFAFSSLRTERRTLSPECA